MNAVLNGLHGPLGEQCTELSAYAAFLFPRRAHDDDWFAEGIAGEKCIDQLLRIRVHREEYVLWAGARECDRLVTRSGARLVESLETQQQRLGHDEGERILAREWPARLACLAFVSRFVRRRVVEIVWRRADHS